MNKDLNFCFRNFRDAASEIGSNKVNFILFVIKPIPQNLYQYLKALYIVMILRK